MERRSFLKALGLIAAAPKLVVAETPAPVVESPVVHDAVRGLTRTNAYGYKVADVQLEAMTDEERKEFFWIIQQAAKDQVEIARLHYGRLAP